jgi:menaquinone-dependent protoporphyrinogen oxidase
MNHKILVTYASRTGSTAEIAGLIAKTLVGQGETVDILPVQDVTDLNPYAAVLLGSGVRFGQWLPEAQTFVEQQGEALKARPLALFTVHGLNLGDDETSRTQRQAYLAKVRRLLNPKSEVFFAGKIDLSKLNFFERLLAKAVKPSGVQQDMAAVRAWAEQTRLSLFGAG